MMCECSFRGEEKAGLCWVVRGRDKGTAETGIGANEGRATIVEVDRLGKKTKHI